MYQTNIDTRCIAKNVSQYIGKTLRLMSNTDYRDAVSKKILAHVDSLFKQEQDQ